MSFNTRLNDLRRVQRGTGRHTSSGRQHTSSVATQITEDKQPNESINKRALNNPPVIRTTQPAPRGRASFDVQVGRGRGHGLHSPRGGSVKKPYLPSPPSSTRSSTTIPVDGMPNFVGGSGRGAMGAGPSTSRSIAHKSPANASSLGMTIDDGHDQAPPASLISILRAQVGMRPSTGGNPMHESRSRSGHVAQSQFQGYGAMAAGATGDVDATEQLDGPSGTANGHNKGKRQNRKKWRALASARKAAKATRSPAVYQDDDLAQEDPVGEPPRKRRRVTPEVPDLQYPEPDMLETPSMYPEEEAPAADAFTTDRTPPVAGARETTVKRERSPSPMIAGGPALVTEGALRFAPIPEQCRKGRPGFQANRHAWAAQEKRRLHKLSINVVRVFIRDDGMVIDWSSPVPVMSDTLLPPVIEGDPSAQNIGEESPEIIELDSFEPQAPHNEPPPPHNEPLPPQNELPPPPNEPSPPASASVVQSNDLTITLPSVIDLVQDITDTSLSPPSAEEQELQRLALAFLQKYIRLFDRNRAALAGAYSHAATFSVTTHDPSSPASSPSLRDCALRLRQGRADVVTGLLALPAGRKFLPSGPRDVNYDVVCLENKMDVMLICYVGETKDEDGLDWACDQRFVLRKKEWDDVDRSTGGLWPLIAVSHQMTTRETVPALPRPIAL